MSEPKFCKVCYSSGVMVLTSYSDKGELIKMKAPCLNCSADKNLNDIERATELEEELNQIRLHNKRMASLSSKDEE